MTQADSSSVIAAALANGDLSALAPEQKGAYYKQVCESLQLNYLTSPLYFQTSENGRETLAVNKVGAAQLRKIHGISVIRVEREIGRSVAIFTVYGKDKDGREDSATGVSDISGLEGLYLANAIMGAETKAKNRLTVSLSGVGFLDESEVAGRRADIAATSLKVPESAIALATGVNQAPATETTDTRPVEIPATFLREASGFASLLQETPMGAPVTIPNSPEPAPQPAPAPEPAPVVPQPQPAPEATVAPAPAPEPEVKTQPLAHSPVPVEVQGSVGIQGTTRAEAIAAAEDIPATPAEYQQFVTNRASKVLRDVLQKANVKNASNLIQEWFMRESGKQSLKKISAATWERMLGMIEGKTADEIVAIFKGGKK